MVQHPRLAVTRPTYIATDAVPFPEISIQLFPIGVNKKGTVRTLARRQKAGTNPPTGERRALTGASEGVPTSDASISKSIGKVNPSSGGQTIEPVAVEQGQSINFPQEETITKESRYKHPYGHAARTCHESGCRICS